MHPRAVNQAVQRSGRRPNALEPAGDFIGRGQVEGRCSVAATIKESQCLRKTLLIAPSQNNVRTQLADQASRLTSNPGGSASDQNGLARQIHWIHHGYAGKFATRTLKTVLSAIG